MQKQPCNAGTTKIERLFTTQLIVKRGQADAKSLEGIHGMPVVHCEPILAHLYSNHESQMVLQMLFIMHNIYP